MRQIFLHGSVCRRKKLPGAVRNVFFGLVALAAVVSVLGYFGVRLLYLNTSESTVRGLYVVRPAGTLSVGDMVIVPLPQDVAGLERGTRMLKQVRGVAGDEYLVAGDTFYVSGESYPIMRHPLLPELVQGVHVVSDGRLVLLNSHRLSLDSRYLGEFDVSAIEHCVVCFFTFEPFYVFYDYVVSKWGRNL